MFLKALMGVSILAGTTVAAVAQDEPPNQTPKPTLAEVQHLAEVISSDKSRLRAYCELGKLHDETQQAVEAPPRLTLSNNNSVLSMTKYSMD
jgi:hypothetical protein